MTETEKQQSNTIQNWQAYSTHPDVIDHFTEKMREVIDPEIGLNIIELGLVRNLTINDDSASVDMILTTPFCPYAPAMIEMTRKKAEEALEMPATVQMGTEMWDPTMMEEGAGGDWGLF
jgi:metal-sulfur cluster biosynthetic enzyme